MPHFFLNVRGDQFRIDERGIELPDVEAVRLEAVELLANMLTIDPGILPFAANWWIDVSDERGVPLFRIDISASDAPAKARTKTKLTH